jgi:hypothetical protein
VCDGQRTNPLLFAVFIRDSHNDCAGALLYSLFTPLLVLPPPEIKNSKRLDPDTVMEMAQILAFDFLIEINVSINNSGIANGFDLALR